MVSSIRMVAKLGQNGNFSQNGKFGQNGMSGQKGKVHLGPNVSSSAHYLGCVVNGSGAMAVLLLLASGASLPCLLNYPNFRYIYWRAERASLVC